MGAFCQQGWKPQAYPVDFQTSDDFSYGLSLDLAGNLRLLGTAFHEWLGLAAYRFTGKINRLLPGPGDQC